MSAGLKGKASQDTDRTDGIVWQTTKPKLISRNLSTGNLQSLERRVGGSTNGGARPNQLTQFEEQTHRKCSLPSVPMSNTSSAETQRPRGGSFFKELMGNYDLKKDQNS